jgi:hypothetical protein
MILTREVAVSPDTGQSVASQAQAGHFGGATPPRVNLKQRLIKVISSNHRIAKSCANLKTASDQG